MKIENRNWKIVLADSETDSRYELFLIGFNREDAIQRAWEAVGDDTDTMASCEPLPDEELPFVNPDSVIFSPLQPDKPIGNKHRGSRMGRITGDD